MSDSEAPLRFLVVDDDEDLRDLMSRFVEKLGHTAHQASDGVEAVEALALETYDFMLLDLTMPRMSGEDVLRWLHTHPQWGKGLRVIVVSAWARASRLDLGEVGAYAVLPKPLRLQQLRDVIAASDPSEG
jgi:CheY-like chemotaxis protein